MGCILYELVFRKKAFHHDSMFHQYPGQQFPAVPSQLRSPTAGIDSTFPADSKCRAHLVKVIYAMLELEPSKRPTARDLHGDFKKIEEWNTRDKEVELMAVLDGVSLKSFTYKEVHPEFDRHLETVLISVLDSQRPLPNYLQ
jgi:hypothetical protein